MNNMTNEQPNINLMEGLCNQIDRVKKIIKQYEAIGAPGAPAAFASSMMKASIAVAERARNSGDVISMLAAYKDLEEYEL